MDEDDPTLSEYHEYHFVGRRIRTAAAILSMLQHVETPYAMLGSDDIVFMTPGWDEKFVAAMPEDDLAIIYGRDGWKDSVNHFMFSMKWHHLIGLFPPKLFDHFGPDTWVCDIARWCNRLIRVDDVMIEHRHCRNGKAEHDATYSSRGKDAKNILEETQAQRKRDAATVMQAIANFQSSKEKNA